MSPEIETYSRQITSLIERLGATVDGLGDSQLNRRPALPGANSAYAIAAHVLGNARAWVLGIVCGQPVRRDRPAEFAASGTQGDLAEAAKRLTAQIESALAALGPADLDRRLLPSQQLWGEGEPRDISLREALIEVVEHASIHLGQLQITRDLALREAAG